VGWGCLPGPSFVCPRRCLCSGLHHLFPSSSHGPRTPPHLVNHIKMVVTSAGEWRRWFADVAVCRGCFGGFLGFLHGIVVSG